MFKEESNGWCCTLANSRLQMIQIDFRLSLLISNGVEDAWVHIETEGKFKFSAQEAVFVPQNTESLAPVLRLFNTKVIGISITKVGKLEIKFERNCWLEAGPDQSYEAWQVSCSGGNEDKVMLVCEPGGKVTLFRDGAISPKAKNSNLN
jgi:hypothetical protein